MSKPTPTPTHPDIETVEAIRAVDAYDWLVLARTGAASYVVFTMGHDGACYGGYYFHAATHGKETESRAWEYFRAWKRAA